MKTIIHIGQHKTGTTSIQHFLRDNRSYLAGMGLYVPSGIAGYNHPSHFILNVYALDSNRYSSMKEKLIKINGKQYLEKLKFELINDIELVYSNALNNKCNRVIWSNEGLYLLNSVQEYMRLASLFSKYSNEIEVVCCFRDINSYRDSYIRQLNKQNIAISNDPDSYRYVERDSWLFDYERKNDLLERSFDKCICFSYDPNNNVKKFMKKIGYDAIGTERYRLNVAKGTYKNLLQRVKNLFNLAVATHRDS